MDKFILKIKNIINDIKQDKTKKTIATISLIVVCFFAFNLGGLLNKVLTSITSILSNETEIKTVEFTSDGYDTEEDGSFKVTKHADWTSTSTAQITWTMESYIEKDSVKKDIILVLDTSASMETVNVESKMTCTRLECAQKDINELIKEVLSEDGNKMALITFNDDATILSNFTDDEVSLIELVNSLTPRGDTNYNQALIKVDELLSSYTKEDGREVEVLFITDGYPNIETPNQNATYEELKSKYPYARIHGMQYEMGHNIIPEIEKVSDKQYATDANHFMNYLIEATFSPSSYETFEIVDYIDNDYFTVESIDDISATVGDVTLTTENGVQKVTWTAPNEILTGNEYKLRINLKLKNEYIGVKGLYPTNTKEIVKLRLAGQDLIEFNTDEVPKLKMPYKLTYEANAPTGCSASIDIEEEHLPFSTVKFTSQTLECEGYQFKGWDTVQKTTKVNSEAFIMPTEDVVVRGIWTKMNVDKDMEGKVYEKLTLYKTIAEQAVPDNIKSEYVTSGTGIDFGTIASDTNGKGVYTIASTLEDKYPIHYYRGDIDNNHVLFAGFCWEIVRTTDTGGVKLIYDGTPVDGVCDNDGSASRLSSKTVFNSTSRSLAHVSYMYNTVYARGVKTYAVAHEVMYRKSGMSGTNFYYGTSVEYDDTTATYNLVDPVQYTWETNYSSLIGTYTCFSATATSCSEVYYVGGGNVSYAYYIYINNGNLLKDVDDMFMSSSYTDNGDGTYTLDSPQIVKRSEWFTNYNTYKKYYVCDDNVSTTCESLRYLSNASNYTYTYINVASNYLYGNSFKYDEDTGMYTLVDTVQFWDWSTNYNKLNNNHYTCLNTTGSCSTIYYMYFTNSSRNEVISIKDGKGIEDAINEMLYADDVNTYDSDVKKKVDAWYSENMVDYTNYLEDTIWCNDRTIAQLGGWNPDGGSMSANLYFNADNRKTSGSPSLECSLVTDSLTLKVENGGTEGYGSNSLTYPTALITGDEIIYAGGQNSVNTNFYLYTKEDMWALTAHYFIGNNGFSFAHYLSKIGALNDYYGERVSMGVRPMVSLKPGIEYSRGNGTPESPYVIDLNSVE